MTDLCQSAGRDYVDRCVASDSADSKLEVKQASPLIFKIRDRLSFMRTTELREARLSKAATEEKLRHNAWEMTELADRTKPVVVPELLAQRGWSDLAIRNLFIIPTILFLIVFNIFPLIYSLGYSFTDFRASTNAPANFVGLQNYRDLLNDPFVLRQAQLFADRAKKEAGDDPASQIDLAYRIALTRPPSETELAVALDAVKNHSLVDLTHVLMNLNEFVYIR